jgi:hypothetical protein
MSADKPFRIIKSRLVGQSAPPVLGQHAALCIRAGDAKVIVATTIVLTYMLGIVLSATYEAEWRFSGLCQEPCSDPSCCPMQEAPLLSEY